MSILELNAHIEVPAGYNVPATDLLINGASAETSELDREYVCGSTPSAGSGIIQPTGGYKAPGTFDAWVPIAAGNGQWRGPKNLCPVWIDPRFKDHYDNEGNTLYEDYKEMFLGIHRICGMGYVEVPSEQARWRFICGDDATITRLSVEWEVFGHAGRGYSSVYYAAKKGNRDIYTGTRLKDAMGGGRLSKINAIRIPRYAFLLAMGWAPQDLYSPIWAARNPNLSGQIRYCSRNEQVNYLGLAGFDWFEIGWFSNAGPLWIWRQEKALS